MPFFPLDRFIRHIYCRKVLNYPHFSTFGIMGPVRTRSARKKCVNIYKRAMGLRSRRVLSPGYIILFAARTTVFRANDYHYYVLLGILMIWLPVRQSLTRRRNWSATERRDTRSDRILNTFESGCRITYLCMYNKWSIIIWLTIHLFTAS